MKKLIFASVLLMGGFSYAAQEPTDISPVNVSSQAINTIITQPRLVTFAPTSPNDRNCITDISASATKFPAGGWSLYILDGQQGTTAYALSQTTGTIVEDFYKGNPLCLSIGATTYVYISTGDWNMNVFGYQKSR